MRDAVVREAAVRDAVVREAAAREAALRESAIREAAVREAAVRDAVVREAAVREAVARDAVVREAVARDVAVREAVVRDAAQREAAAREVAAREAAAREVVTREVVARDISRLSSPRNQQIELKFSNFTHGNTSVMSSAPHASLADPHSQFSARKGFPSSEMVQVSYPSSYRHQDTSRVVAASDMSKKPVILTASSLEKRINDVISQNQAIVETMDPLWKGRYMRQSSRESKEGVVSKEAGKDVSEPESGRRIKRRFSSSTTGSSGEGSSQV